MAGWAIGAIVNQKDIKRFKKMLEENRKEVLSSARKTLAEEATFDTDDLPDEIDLASSEYTQSMVFRLRDREKFLLKKIDDALARIETLYKPYHRALRRLISRVHQAFGTVVVVDCHSMPSIGVSRDEPRRPDVVIGDRYGTSCAPLLPDRIEETMSRLGYSIGRNKPYAGGFITEHYGNPASGLHAVQLELNRAIYMDERRREKGPRFAQVAADFTVLAEALATVPLDDLGPFQAAAE